MSPRETALAAVASALVNRRVPHPFQVAIDGRTASGKTTLADELEHILAAQSRPVIRTSIDGFQRSRSDRYARGRFSAQGYFNDARDLAAVLEPLGPGGNRYYRTVSFDYENDLPFDEPPNLAAQDSIVLVDGTFLQRPELKDLWDIAVFIDVTEDASTRGRILRDSKMLGGHDDARTMIRSD